MLTLRIPAEIRNRHEEVAADFGFALHAQWLRLQPVPDPGRTDQVRRADLIPNIVATVKGEANFEQETLTRVIEARSRATAVQVTPETLNNPEAFAKFQQAQGELSSALSRLMVVSERYPTLQANQGFRDLRVQLEGTENRITVARNRYIQAVQQYNVLARSFPTNLTAMIFNYDPKPSFTVQNEAQISVPPTVDFGKPAAGAPPAPGTAAPSAPASATR
jgi:LemA protein